MHPEGEQDVSSLLQAARERADSLIARGEGRSYGDAAQNENGVIVDLRGLSWIGSIDHPSRTVAVGAGTTLAALLGPLAEQGLTLPVVPGTKHITVGGAIAADIHGKNHLCDGSFGHHVEAITLCTPEGETRELSRDQGAELFFATLGGMGLTGVIVEATIWLRDLPSHELWADIDRTEDLVGAIALVAEPEPRHRYAIAWIDLLAANGPLRARGHLGRSVVLRSDYVGAPPASPRENKAPRAREDRQKNELPRPPASHTHPAGRAPLRRRPRLSVPQKTPQHLLNPALVCAFNELRWRRAPKRAREERVSLEGHFFPLDALGDWNRLYGPRGLIQYQCLLPLGAQDALQRVVEIFLNERVPIYLAVLKRMGEGSGGLLSFPREGLTLAMDMPAKAERLDEALKRADRLVAEEGGCVYLAKDAKLAKESLEQMYPQLESFREIRRNLDPQEALQSDMARRLGLCQHE